MFFDEVSLKKDGWYNKVFRFVFPRAPRYDNFCPFFWLTILALFVSPFKGLWVGMAWFGSQLGKSFLWTLENFIARPLTVMMYRNYAPEELLIARDIYLDDNLRITKCDRLRYEKLWNWINEKRSFLSSLGINVGNDMSGASEERRRQLLENLKAKWKEEDRRTDEIARRRRKQKEKVEEIVHQVKGLDYNPLIRIGKIIGSIFGIIFAVVASFFALGLLYYLILLIGWLWYWIWVGIWYMGQWNWLTIGEGFLIAVLIMGFVFFTTRLLIKMADCPRCRKFLCDVGEVIGKFFSHVGLGVNQFFIPLAWIGRGFYSFFSFFWTMFLAFKAKNCPAIKWDD